MMVEWQTYHDVNGNPFQYIEVGEEPWRFRVDEWEYRYGWRDEHFGQFFHTDIGAIAYAENQCALRGGRYRVVKL